jgi:hypothetical protein
LRTARCQRGVIDRQREQQHTMSVWSSTPWISTLAGVIPAKGSLLQNMCRLMAYTCTNSVCMLWCSRIFTAEHAKIHTSAELPKRHHRHRSIYRFIARNQQLQAGSRQAAGAVPDLPVCCAPASRYRWVFFYIFVTLKNLRLHSSLPFLHMWHASTCHGCCHAGASA